MEGNKSASGEAATRKKINPELYWLGLLLLLAIVIRIVAVLTREMVQFDETSYARMARNLLDGKSPLEITGLSATQFSILFPFVTAAIAVVTRSVTAAGYAVAVLFSSLMILPTYMFGKVMWNRRVATAAAALVAVLPVLVDAGSTIEGHNIFAFWLMSAMFFGYRMQFTKRCMCGMLAGTCLGLAYLADPSALYYLLTLLVLLVFIGFRQEVANYANKAAAHFLLMFLLFAVPGIVFLSYERGGLTLSDRPDDSVYASVNNLEPGSIAWEQAAYGLNEGGGMKLYEIREGDGYFTSLIDSPGAILKATARSDWRDYFRNVNSLIPVWLLPLIGLGMFAVVWTRREALKYGYFLIVLLPLLVLPVIWNSSFYALPYMGIAMLLVARGWMSFEAWSIGTIDEITGYGELSASAKRNIQVAVAALVMVPLVALSFWYVLRTDYPVQYRHAGEWLSRGGEEDIRIMSRESSTAFYAGGNLVWMPYAPVEQMVDYARNNEVDYMIVSRGMADGLRPQLDELMDPEGSAVKAAGIEAVYRDGQGTDKEVIVYRIDGGGG